jgi:hypothetical protein
MAGTLCDQFYSEGRPDLGDACLSDESYERTRRAREKYQSDIQRHLDQQQEEADRVLREIGRNQRRLAPDR